LFLEPYPEVHGIIMMDVIAMVTNNSLISLAAMQMLQIFI
jgi:hypothetical protein